MATSESQATITRQEAQLPEAPTSDIGPSGDSVPPEDEIQFLYHSLKEQYENMKEYLVSGRDQMLINIQETSNRIRAVEESLPFVSPAAFMALTDMINQQRMALAQVEEEVKFKDTNLQPSKEALRNQLMTYYHTIRPTLESLVQHYQWPTMQACQDLDLPMEIMQLVAQPGGSRHVGGTQDDSMLQALNNRIKALEDELKSAKEEKKDKGDPAGTKQMENVTDRRKRTRIPAFDQGTIADAQKWLNSYETLCRNFLKYTNEELVDELYAVLHGRAGNWFTSLGMDVKKDWNLVKKNFLHQFGGGAKPALSAFNELKRLKQGTMAISEFVNIFQDLIYRSQIFAPDIQLDYFKEQIRPELCDAVVYGRAQDLVTAIEIATDAEREWERNGKYRKLHGGIPAFTTTTNSKPIVYETAEHSQQGSQQQNYQRNYQQKPAKKCYNCGKPGHFKKDCRKKTPTKRFGYTAKQQNTQHSSNNQQEDDDVDIFSHFFQNQQHDEQEIDITTNNPNRFHVWTQQDNQQKTKALIDTGATINTISAKLADNWKLDTFKCNNVTIKYGNSSKQQTSTKAVIDFSLDENTTSRAFVYIVEHQNEDIILGMDWMRQEDIILYPKTKTIKKVHMEYNNDLQLDIPSMIETEYSHLVTETKYHSITNAPYKHRIDTGDALPVAKRDYRRSHKENMEIQQEVDKMLAAKVIIPSNSDWCSPVVLAPKPDGTKRFCVDYRGLNKVTIKDKYPIPRISELLNSLHGSKYFSCIDLKSGYWQLPMDPQDAKKTAFIANGSLYEFTCLPFGVVNGPSSFMRFMHGVLRGVKNTMVYLDDVIIYSKTKEQHVQDLRNVLTKLDQYNLKISLKKCQFFQQEVKFLGFLVSRNGIRSDPNKVEVVRDWPRPTNMKELQRFLGFCAFYHRFIANLSTMAKPLYNLLQKQEKFIWNDKAQAAFEALKQRMVELPTLAYPDTEAPYDLHSDASDYGLGAVLVQRSRPIAYASRTLQPAELNYSTTEKECLAVVWALNYFYPYLYGADFTIYTDHAALRSILATKMPRGRIARWILTIQAYRFTVIHKKGSLNADADALSRLYEKQNQQDIAQLSMEEFKRHQEDDKIIQVLKGEKKDCYVITNGLLCYKKKDDKLVPILPQMMVETVISKYHDGITGGHFGIDKTVDKIKEVAWWPNMVEDVKEYIRTCPACQIYKVRNDSTVARMKPILPRYTGEIWAADIAELPKSNNGNTYMLVLVEYLSKWAITVALPSFSTDHVAQVLLYDVVLKFGVPSRLITDNGSNFVSEAMAMVCSRLGIKRTLTSVEHPQTDGLVERMNRTIKISLAAYVGKDNKLDWDTYLPFVTFAYNTATQASTGFSPFEILFGRKAVLPLNEELIIDPKTYETESWINYLNTYLPLVHGEAIENLKKAQERQKKFYDDRRTIKHDYKSGDLIVRRNLLKTSFPKEHWTGPWMVLRKNNEDGTSYVIQKPG